MIRDATGLVTNPAGRTNAQGQLLPVVPTIGIGVHHSVGNSAVQDEAGERATIRAIDLQHVGQGFGGFGYHYIVFPSGRAYFCGGGQRAHVAGRNHELIGVVLSGTFTAVQPTEAAMSGLREVLLHLRAEWDIPVKGHREWALPGEGTACPGVVVPRDWEAFLAPPAPPPMPDGWVASHNQVLCFNGNGDVVVAIGDWEGERPGQISKLFGETWYWLRRGKARENGDYEAFWSPVKGD